MLEAIMSIKYIRPQIPYRDIVNVYPIMAFSSRGGSLDYYRRTVELAVREISKTETQGRHEEYYHSQHYFFFMVFDPDLHGGTAN